MATMAGYDELLDADVRGIIGSTVNQTTVDANINRPPRPQSLANTNAPFPYRHCTGVLPCQCPWPAPGGPR
jgi:hypothetical protein